MNAALDFNIFKKEDFPEYLTWFQDPDLHKRLGPMEDDDEWLTEILQDDDGCTYSVFMNEKLVAVIGLVFPNKEFPIYCISSIAVKPMLRSKGIGKKVLQGIIELHPLEKGQYWKAFVDEKNPKATSFFERNGWKFVGRLPENNEMLVGEYGNESRNAD